MARPKMSLPDRILPKVLVNTTPLSDLLQPGDLVPDIMKPVHWVWTGATFGFGQKPGRRYLNGAITSSSRSRQKRPHMMSGRTRINVTREIHKMFIGPLDDTMALVPIGPANPLNVNPFFYRQQYRTPRNGAYERFLKDTEGEVPEYENYAWDEFQDIMSMIEGFHARHRFTTFEELRELSQEDLGDVDDATLRDALDRTNVLRPRA